MKKLPKAKMNKMANNLIKRTQAKMLKIMYREANTGDYSLVEMYAIDFANLLCICYDIKNGNFVEAYDNWIKLDTDVRDMFPNTLIDMLDKASDYEYHHNGEQ